MPAYHSSYNDELNVRQVAGAAILPLNSKIRGPAPLPGVFERLWRVNIQRTHRGLTLWTRLSTCSAQTHYFVTLRSKGPQIVL